VIIDSHCHLWIPSYLPDIFVEGQARFFSEWFITSGIQKTPSDVKRDIFPQYWDTDGTRTIESMDKANIAKAFLLPLDFGPDAGELERGIELQNEDLAAIAIRYPDRFVPFVGIDPRRPKAKEVLLRGIKEWKVKGVKWEAFPPAKDEGLPLLEIAEKEGLILIAHQGSLFPPFDTSHHHPRDLDMVLAKFPDLKVVAAHMAFAWWREFIEIAVKRPNLFCDFSAWQLVAKVNFPQFCHILRRVADGIGPNRILFGTDSPTFDPLMSKREWVGRIKSLSVNPPKGVSFTEEEINGFLYLNSQNLV
jgi:predicted TIM-barrel fold metal-dependent hydrolase